MHISCSKLARPMVCAGYVFLDLPESEKNNEKAKEGDAAGEYLERLLTGKPITQIASNGLYFDEDMKFFTTPIANDIKNRAATEVICEEKINWETRAGVWIKGRPDATFVDEHGVLCIEDLKYGYGIIEVEENWQLIAYAIGEVIRRGQGYEKISMKIHQPRAHHEDGSSREWVISYSELLEYKERIEDRMTELTNGRRDFQTSDQCKYCMGAAEACPAFNRLFHGALEVSTKFVQDSITDQELSRQLDIIKRAEEAIKIKKDSLEELGVMRIKQGSIIPGYVQTKRFGNRSWRNGITPESIKLMTGKDPIEKKFMTPAKVEKLGVPKDLVNSLTEKKFIGTKLEKASKDIGNKIFGNENPQGGK